MEKWNGKVSFRQSSLTTWRQKEPSNPYMSSKCQTSMFDFSKGMNLWPDSKPASLIENTKQKRPGAMRSVNNGKNLALSLQNATVGSRNVGEVRGVVSYPGSKRPRPISKGR